MHAALSILTVKSCDRIVAVKCDRIGLRLANTGFQTVKCQQHLLFKHEDALYKEVFPGKIEAHLSVTVKVRGSNSKLRAI